MGKIQISSTLVEEQIEKLQSASGKMSSLFESIRKEINGLKPFWNSKTSEIEFSEFASLFQQFDAIEKSNSNYISFLENTVKSSYETVERKMEQSIENSTLDTEGTV